MADKNRQPLTILNLPEADILGASLNLGFQAFLEVAFRNKST